MISLAELHSIFYSGTHTFTSDKELLVKIQFLIKHKYLLFSEEVICSKEHYIDTASDQSLMHQHAAAGGVNPHKALILLAIQYLNNQGVTANYEQPFCGYFPDVLSNDKKIIVECGHTDNIDKLFTYFNQGKIDRFIQVPYPDSNDRDIKAHVFVPQSKNLLAQFLIECESHQQSSILSLLNSRNK